MFGWGLAAGVGVVGVLPLVGLLWYAHPALDDFSYAGQYARLGFCGAQRELYMSLTGRYLASALLGWANPLSYGWLAGQGVAGGRVLLLWGVGLLALVHELLRPLLSWGQAAVGAQLLLALSLAQQPSPAEGLYWLAGAYTYLVPTALLLGLLAVLLRRHRLVGRARLGWSCVAAALLVASMGGNEITGLVLLASLAAAAVLGGPTLRLWPLVAVAAVGAAVAWGAPGNFVRLHSMAHRPPLLVAVAKSGAAAAYCVVTWLGTGVLPLAGLLVAGWVQAQSQARLRPLPLASLTRRPLVLTGLLLALLVLSFVPSFWATGLPMPRRARNGMYALFVVGWLLVLYGWLAWYWQRYPAPAPARWPRPVVLTAWAWLGLALLTDHNLTLRHDQMGASPSTVVQAYRDWLGGSAAAYDRQQRARYAQLREVRPPGGRVRLDPLRAQPPTLFYYDISVDEQLWGNRAYAQFFGVPAVYVAPPAAARGVGP